MGFRTVSSVFLAIVMLARATASPFPMCSGTATYKIFFLNKLSRAFFGDLIPENGLVYSPLSAVSHSNRISLFTIRGFASKEVETIAETGNNVPFLNLAKKLRDEKRGVLSVVNAGGPTMPGNGTSLTVRVDCEHNFMTAIGMIAPSPDWIVQINNMNLFDMKSGRFVSYLKGDLIAYDAGVDDGREFTPPMDLSLDMPTMPQKNIAPLVEDETDRFEGRVVGKYIIKKIA